MAQVPFALANRVPENIKAQMNSLASYGDGKIAVEEMKRRQRETKDFTSDTAAFLAGLMMVPDCRRSLERKMDDWWNYQRYLSLPSKVKEVVVGGGLHAAIYCAVRRKLGHPRPLVLEAQDRIGGTFAMTKEPAFFLNSRNRPGDLGLPGDLDAALNVIPGSLIQPCDLSASEYQRNSDLAFCVRMALLMHSTAVPSRRVFGVYASGRVKLKSGTSIDAEHVIDARGLGSPANTGSRFDGKRILSYQQFMARMDTPFPLKGMRRVAVIGAGDSGKTAVESLLGQGPSSQWSVASLDWIERIDWYSPTIQTNRARWCEANRSRYQGIGRFMPIYDEDNETYTPSKIRPLRLTASTWGAGYNCAYVDDKPYDCVIVCQGYAGPESLWQPEYETSLTVGGRQVGRYVDGASGLVKVGPAARIPLSSYEQNTTVGRLPENEVALFRLADRTATVAATMDGALL